MKEGWRFRKMFGFRDQASKSDTGAERRIGKSGDRTDKRTGRYGNSPKIFGGKRRKEWGGKGTAMHHVMQRLDFTAADTVRQVEAQLLELQRKSR